MTEIEVKEDQIRRDQQEIDRLRKENAELNKLASLKLSRSRIKELQAENKRLQAVVQSSAMISAKAEGLARELKHDAEMHLGTDKQIHAENLQLSGLLNVGDIHGERVKAIEAIKSENMRLAAALDHTACLEERLSTVRAGHLPECPCERCMLARELLRDSAILRKLTGEKP